MIYQSLMLVVKSDNLNLRLCLFSCWLINGVRPMLQSNDVETLANHFCKLYINLKYLSVSNTANWIEFQDMLFFPYLDIILLLRYVRPILQLNDVETLAYHFCKLYINVEVHFSITCSYLNWIFLWVVIFCNWNEYDKWYSI